MRPPTAARNELTGKMKSYKILAATRKTDLDREPAMGDETTLVLNESFRKPMSKRGGS